MNIKNFERQKKKLKKLNAKKLNFKNLIKLDIKFMKDHSQQVNRKFRSSKSSESIQTLY